ncbi:YcaO-like family protein [Streptomyces sp. TRM66268-LWL]|uniref:YcaO-like family protein n=1 Tax=Streptomyces polyasparticus TaxID=2767826 RepID=A0ABR7SVH9_9ACTN|nr:YcaO-like family protein [Streptomyces polyasparticus]MBC9718874.1 YcaO-like family protein [Streptomyces polyasparticus]
MMIDIPRTLAPHTGIAAGYALTPPQNTNPLWSAAVALHPVDGMDSDQVPLSAAVAGAHGHSRADALVRGAGEAVERRALHPDPGVYACTAKAADLGRPAFDAPQAALAHPKAADTPLTWYPARRLSDHATVLVPAGLVDWPVATATELFDPSPSGAAAGNSHDMALRSALVEIVERDAFTTAWGRQLALPAYTDPTHAVAPLSGNSENPAQTALFALWQQALQADITPTLAYIPTAVPGLWCVVACLVEPERPGALATVGMKASGRPHEALLGALQEAWQVRTALHNTPRATATGQGGPIITEHDRIDYLCTPQAYAAVRDWVAGFTPATQPMEQGQITTRTLTDAVLADGADPLVVDLTPRLPLPVAAMGWHAVKVIPAGYQNLRMDERHQWSWHPQRMHTAPQRTGCPARLDDHRDAPPHPLP